MVLWLAHAGAYRDSCRYWNGHGYQQSGWHQLSGHLHCIIRCGCGSYADGDSVSEQHFWQLERSLFRNWHMLSDHERRRQCNGDIQWEHDDDSSELLADLGDRWATGNLFCGGDGVRGNSARTYRNCHLER